MKSPEWVKNSKILTFLMILVVISNVALVTSVKAAVIDPYSQFESLRSSNPELTRSRIGYSVDGKSIWMYAIGTQSKPVILIDSEIHGYETGGSDALYYVMKWLTESGSTNSRAFLSNYYFKFIPIVNPDSYRIENVNVHGVNLNRNFPVGWQKTSISGPSVFSEPEAKALAKVIETKPALYITLHCNDGVWLDAMCQSAATTSAQFSAIYSSFKTKCSSLGVTIWPCRRISSVGGSSARYAASLGIKTWLIEVSGVMRPTATVSNTNVVRLESLLLCYQPYIP